ncbi:amino acid ABC transporter permease [Gluconacetobacter takamatsuzukensis]|uniref:Amino acid ABC transporter permease n=1 Tax=Gluconacetobacter takamatsuzukensis TaxID=1286190 RepID=A0A7W4KEB6_9PROT|nr:amino acid ABC transporter permease [Gluconacetobacter takamatsuzukensis]MBB2205399.1 amino acid ABC transporter permease [Gluconacetobacter takamatsuzukensis]
MHYTAAWQQLHWSDATYVLMASVRTLQLSFTAVLLGTLLGIPLGLARALSPVMRVLTAPLVDVVRSVPMIIQLIIFDTCLSISGWPLSAFQLGTLALGAWMAMVTAEIVRGAYEAVTPSLRRAARSLGMSSWQELRVVSLPLTLRGGFPAWVGAALCLVKDSALVGIFGYIELTKAGQILNARTHRTFLVLGGIGATYFFICHVITFCTRRIERRMAE